MASGDTLVVFTPTANEQGVATNYATLNVRNFHPVLEFDTGTQETAMFSGIMPQNYANTTGVTIIITMASLSSTTGTLGFGVTFERCTDGALDLDGDGFATEKLGTPVTVPGTAGIATTQTITCAKGATDMDSVVAGDLFRLRVRRDVANDNSGSDGHLLAVEIRET